MANVLKEQLRRQRRYRGEEFPNQEYYESYGRRPYDRYEQERGYPSGRYGRQDIYDWETEYGDTGYRGSIEEDWTIPGPFTGIGPRNYHRSDERIREDISERLMAHGQIDARNIEMDVKDGDVTLSGEVNSRRAKRMAEDLAESVFGVKDVNNQIRVKEREKETEREQDYSMFGSR